MQRLIWLIIVCITVPFNVIAGGNICEKDDAMAASKVIDQISSIESLHDAYSNYGHCDDGFLSEGFSDKTSEVIVDNWESIIELVELVNADLYFKRFIIHHIDETVPHERFEEISYKSKNQCPDNAKSFCKLLDSQMYLTKELAEKKSQ